MIYGYIRVSTDKQTCEHQKYEIKQFAKAQKVKITYWVEETISSRKSLDKRKLGKLLQTPIGKSGVNHRLKKLSAIAEDLRK